MSDLLPTAWTRETAAAFLQKFVCIKGELKLKPEEKTQVREALTVLTQASDYQTLGICADDLAEGVNTLKAYLMGLGYGSSFEIQDFPDTENPVYMKYNTRKHTHYVDAYMGNYRGVLVTFQSDYSDRQSGTYGHFPLDLFAEPLSS
jgi:hypothetical protein